jgi:hypothetical protein
MTDTKANEAAKNLVKSVQEVNKAIADTAITAQERNLAFAQNVLENGIEVLKSHADSSRTLMQELIDQAKKGSAGPGSFQVSMESALAAQERNTRLAQSILEDGIEVLKSQVGVTRSLMQELGQQFQKQQDAFQTLAYESMEAYRDFVFAPLTFWQKATRQEIETIQKATRQAASMAEKAMRSGQSTE